MMPQRFLHRTKRSGAFDREGKNLEVRSRRRKLPFQRRFLVRRSIRESVLELIERNDGDEDSIILVQRSEASGDCEVILG